jgi:hypothetical protein
MYLGCKPHKILVDEKEIEKFRVTLQTIIYQAALQEVNASMPVQGLASRLA